VILAGVGHPDQSGLGGCNQQAPDRRVDGSVRDVEHVFGVSGGCEFLREATEVIRVDSERPLQSFGEVVFDLHEGFLSVANGRDDADLDVRVRRSAAIPSAAARRAASAVPPRIAATSA
jgi:hypothetical protein